MNTQERRSIQRTKLSRLMEVIVSDSSDVQAVCRILDISPFGLRLEFVAAEDAERFACGQIMTVVRCSEAIQGMLLDKTCEIMWRQGATLGARFRAPLDVSVEELGTNLEFTSF